MSGKFQRLYPGPSRITFDGGLNNKYERSLIEDNESPDCLNVVFSNGGVGTRQGAVKLNTAAVTAFAGDGLYTRRGSDGTETMLAFAGGSMYGLAGTSFTVIASSLSQWTAGVRVAAVQDENYIFMSNGYVIPYKWDGTYFTRHGIYPPTTTSTVTSQATGVLTGAYQYKITNVNSNLVESDVGPVSASLTAASATLRVTLQTFAASYGVSARRIYRTAAGGIVFKRVAVVSDNTSTTYDDNIADSALGVTAPTDNAVPPKYNVAVYHANRLFVIDRSQPQYVWYSELGNPYTFATTNFIRIGDNTSDLCRGLAIYNNALFITCEKSTHIVYMEDTDPANWSPPQRLNISYGCKSPFAIIGYQDKILMPAIDQSGKFSGFAAIKGNAIDPSAASLTFSAAGSDLKSDRFEPDIFLTNETYLPGVSSINYKNNIYTTLPYGLAQTTNNRIYNMDFSISNASRDQAEAWNPWTGINAVQFTIYNGKLYCISATATGFVYQIGDTGVYSDDGAAINSYFWTKEFSGVKTEFNLTKDFRYANFLVDNAGNYNMNINYRVDSDADTTGNVIQVPLNTTSTVWGTGVWGVSPWGGGVEQTDMRVYLGTARGKRIQFRFSNQNTVNQRFTVHWGTFSYILKGYR